MTMQIDLFTPAQTSELVDASPMSDETHAEEPPADEKLGQPIAVPCGFRDRANNPCQQLGNWPVMMNGKQMVCRGRPMLHCDPACFSNATITARYDPDDDDVVWEEHAGAYGDNP